MNFLAYLINALLLGGYWLFSYLHPDGMFFNPSFMMWVFLLCAFTYYRVSITPVKDTEEYKTWQDLLPTEEACKRHRKSTIYLTVFAYVAYLLFELWFVYGKKGKVSFFWEAVQMVVSLFPMLYALLLWAQGKTLKKAKLCFATMEKMLNIRGYVERRTPYKKTITPDTELLDLFKSDKDVLNIPMMVADFKVMYKLPDNFLDKELRKEWKAVAGHIDEYENSKSEELPSEAVDCLVEFGRNFAKKYPTLGSMAIFLVNLTGMATIEEKKESLAKCDAVGKWGRGKKEKSEDEILLEEFLASKKKQENQ